MDVDFNNPGLPWAVSADYGDGIAPSVGFIWGVSFCLTVYPHTPGGVRRVAGIVSTLLGHYARENFFKWSYSDKKRFVAAAAFPVALVYFSKGIANLQRVRNQA